MPDYCNGVSQRKASDVKSYHAVTARTDKTTGVLTSHVISPSQILDGGTVRSNGITMVGVINHARYINANSKKITIVVLSLASRARPQLLYPDLSLTRLSVQQNRDGRRTPQKRIGPPITWSLEVSTTRSSTDAPVRVGIQRLFSLRPGAEGI
ncbi:hypothetical protein JX265_004528 [Neoarthrinium moseri]|uniref:Uncharacterized protein n=1 Tax=Neoarthrinium moseri TaxID=1658444 RepID=A0A9Q0ANU1_9PEZI|nr:uncharacterized protein JN550_008153 [Neoarthrinium moseri]KAI1840616.1 hypothetical protein JX266_013168 [Neoarthrinium moseri]KAI1865895.1 hypothetical protein JN550_008153 [Neoarthrinium moseri]KAI1875470.1 hypothetical protein JX265_004528 [Neoarthrinium moseri]